MSEPVRHIDDTERRIRLARRHVIAPWSRVADPVEATRRMTALHSTEPATVYLSLHARVEQLSVADVDRALYDDRSLVKQLAMRRTLFVFERDLLPAVWGSASARIAPTLAARLAKDIELAGLADDGAAWLAAARSAVMARLADGDALSATQLREQVPELTGRIDQSPGKAYNVNAPIAPRVLTQLGVETAIVRGRNGGHWRVSRPQWTSMAAWLGEQPEPATAADGYAELVRRWLWTFGPGSAADLQWWLGATVDIVRNALKTVGAVPVSLDSGAIGYVLPDDVEAVPAGEPWAALLPVLDPTIMGWKDRDHLLGPHGDLLFDRNGNAGTTAWWNGEAVGCWVQDLDGTVRVCPLTDVDDEGSRAVQIEADRLSGWLDGTRVGTVYPSPAMKRATDAVG